MEATKTDNDLRRFSVVLPAGLWLRIRRHGLATQKSGSAVLRDLVNEGLRTSSIPDADSDSAERSQSA
jgi:hypothetical protein